MAFSRTGALCRFLLPFVVTVLLVLQVSADKEPHEDSKEDDSVDNHCLNNVSSIIYSTIFIQLQIEQGKNSKEFRGTDAPMNDLGFAHAFVASLSVIIVSELGDKTFFIAAIMAMRHSRVVVFSGAILALVIMTGISGKHLAYLVLCRSSLLYYLLFLGISPLWMGNSDNSQVIHILDINCFICHIWPSNVERRVHNVAKRGARRV